ncbi:Condensin-2 complex subunit H2 [Gracilariopsis chorda]|uniref:Condensin-2 complex subunit H2 n=1 Tax=Gracilariopsis chorda TaxID=448386 RepID=A0A2V3IRV8_9FLOR|nr:Condensin-2 complex subunit H2 [Gracilariopsis chorda]|eukprot:PXF44855.1 Condensin-2 complex subunit H2 [Gracilariopsis chorda]
MGRVPHDTTLAPSFSVLLDPIRDLAANWSIDVAKELTEYAKTLGLDLDDEASNVLENVAPVDFAQAALLVQGSTSIYSRKVEHLYCLVYTAVSSLNQLKSQKQLRQSDGDANADSDADEFLADEVDYLTLDDCLPETDNHQVSLPHRDLPPHGSVQDKTCLRQIPPMLVQHGSDALQLASAKFNMLSAHLHPSGALIMPGCPPFDENLEALPEGSTNLAVLYDEQSVPNEDIQLPEVAAAGFDFDEPAYSTPPPPVAHDDDGDDVLVAVASSAKKRRGRVDFLVDREYIESPKRDPFRLLDPHENIPQLEKKLQVGKTFRKPRKTGIPKRYLAFLEDEKSDIDLAEALLGPISRGSSIRSCFCFEGARESYRTVMRQRMAKRRKMRRKASSPTGITFDEENDVLADMEEEEDLDEMRLNTVTFGADEEEEIEMPPFPELDEPGVGMDEAPITDAIPTVSGRRSSGVYQDQLHKLASSYEETCRRYLERTRGLWEQHSVDAKLAKRVENWASKIQPILDDEEKRPEFDIAAYGQVILQGVKKAQAKGGVTEIPMSRLFEGCAAYDVCRKFLATLQLANTYSIEIVPPQECCVSNPTLRLLREVQEHAKTPVKSRSKRARQAGDTPLNVRRRPLRQRLDTPC